jgi:hypothetical protein
VIGGLGGATSRIGLDWYEHSIGFGVRIARIKGKEERGGNHDMDGL